MSRQIRQESSTKKSWVCEVDDYYVSLVGPLKFSGRSGLTDFFDTNGRLLITNPIIQVLTSQTDFLPAKPTNAGPQPAYRLCIVHWFVLR